MLTIVYSTRSLNPAYDNEIRKTCGISDIEIIPIVNDGDKSLTSVYNEALSVAKNDIVCFIHDDILFNKAGKWGQKILDNFKNNPDYGIIGVAGTSQIDKTGIWWSNRARMYGSVWHKPNSDRAYKTIFAAFPKNEIKEVCAIDGLFIACNKNMIKAKFNEEYKGFHFYDITFCVDNFLKGVKIGVCNDIELTHRSIGRTNDAWELNRLKFVDEYKSNLPLNCELEVAYEDVTPLKEAPKVGIIIPTKGKTNLMRNLLDSIIENCNYPASQLKFYIADTGSVPEDKDKVKAMLEDMKSKKGFDYKFIEFSFYHFARINNLVVKEHVDEDVELLLFCNNDIELVNDAITEMVNTYIRHHGRVGTIGARLHYADGSVQHLGMRIIRNQDKETKNYPYVITHNMLNGDYDSIKVSKELTVIGNTAAFMLISKEIFMSRGMFNEKYEVCFEDVEFNVRVLETKLPNICVTNAVCYHLESQTRRSGYIKPEDLNLIQNTISHSLITNIFIRKANA